MSGLFPRGWWPLAPLSALLLLGLGLRWAYAQQMLLTYDEGAYLYDTRHIAEGLVPYRDFLTKGPVFLYSLASFVWLSGPSPEAGRAFSILAALVTTLFLFLIGRTLFSTVHGLLAALIFASFSTPVQYTVYIHTQPFQMALVTPALYLLVRGMSGKGLWLFYGAGLLLGLGYLVRPTALALLLVGVALSLLYGRALRGRLEQGGLLLGGFASVLAPATVLSLLVNGPRKTLDVLGFEMARQAADQKVSLWQQGDLRHFARLFTEFLAEANAVVQDGFLLTLLLGLFLWLLVSVALRLRASDLAASLALFGALLATLELLMGFDHFLKEPETPLFLQGLTVLFGALVLVLALFANQRGEVLPPESPYPHSLLFLLFWLGSLLITYGLWVKFRTPYFTEFLPILSLTGAVSLVWLWKLASVSVGNRVVAWALRAGLVLVVAAFWLQGHRFAYGHPPMGVFSLGQVHEVGAYLKAHAQAGDEVFTAAVIFPYLSGLPVVYKVTHPAWYNPGSNIGEGMLSLYLPRLPEVASYLREGRVRFVVLEDFTQNTYLRGSAELAQHVDEHYGVVHKVGRVQILERRQ